MSARTARTGFDPALHLIVDPGALGAARTAVLVREAVRGGVTVVQMRQKAGSTRELIARARELLGVLRPLGIPLLVNDRVDVAAAAEADGVHVGQDDMPAAIARRILGARAIIGLSAWDVAHAAEAEDGVVDYVGVGPVHPTRGKDDAVAPIGLEGLAAIRARVRVPVVAIGGIDETNADAVVRAGADGVAVINAICGAADPYAAAQALRTRMPCAAERAR